MNKNKRAAVLAAATFIGLCGSAFAQAGGGMGNSAKAGAGTGVGTRGAGMGTGTRKMGQPRHHRNKMSKKHLRAIGMKRGIGKHTGNGPGFSGAAGTGAPGMHRTAP